MGVNFSAIGENHRRAPFLEVRQALESSEEFRAIIHTPSEWFNPRGTWMGPLSTSTDGTVVGSDLPGGFILDVGPTLFTLWHLTRWGVFLSDKRLYITLRRSAKLLSNIVRSQAVFYVPDSRFRPARVQHLIAEGGSMSSVQSWLQQNCGTPTPASSGFSSQLDWDRLYIFDDFSDLDSQM